MKFILPIILLYSLSSCQFFEKDGCPDPDAINYVENAKRDHNSCVYESHGLIYWENHNYDAMVADSITHITIEIDGKTVVENEPIIDYEGAFYPQNCDDPDWISIPSLTYYSSNQVSHKVPLHLYDQNDSLRYASVLHIGKSCQTIRIYYD